MQEQLPKKKLTVTATFTAEPLKPFLEFWCGKLGLEMEPVFAPFNQVFQELLDPCSALNANFSGVNILLVRPQDWVESGAFMESEAWAERVRLHTDHFLEVLAGFAPKTPSFIYAAPESARLEAPRRAAAEEQRRRIEGAADAMPGLHRIGQEELERLYPVAERYDGYADEAGAVPFTREGFAALATLLMRRVSALYRPPVKGIAVDCDYTLWDGVCAEDGPEGVRWDEGYKAVHQLLKEQMRHGRVLCLNSKNAERDVWAVFKARPEFVLREADFAAWRINWKPKPENLRALARELNVGTESFVFLDDSPVECAAMRAACPEVITLQLPGRSRRFARYLEHVWAFDFTEVTEEDRQRAAMYRQQADRSRMRAGSVTLEEFIEGLDLQVRIDPPEKDQWTRAAQLTQRTNQFNARPERRMEPALRRLVEEGAAEMLVVEVEDRFGSYGLTGLAVFEALNDALVVDTFLLSCRVLGRGVEYQLLNQLGRIAQDRNLNRITIQYEETPRNAPVHRFLEQVARRDAAGAYELSPEAAVAARFAPQTPAEPLEEAAAPAIAAAGVAVPLDYDEIAQIYSRVETIVDAVHPPLSSGSDDLTSDCSPTEARVLQVWQELLGRTEIGLEEEFFMAGGDSLLMVEAVSRLGRLFGRAVPMTVFFEQPTVRRLAAWFDAQSDTERETPDLLSLIDQLTEAELAEYLNELEQRP